MSNVLDEIEKQEALPELSQKWKHLQIVFGVILFIAAGLALWGGVEMELSMDEWRSMGIQFSIYIEIRTILMLFVSPLIMITGALLLISSKRIGWILSLTSYFSLTVLIFFFYNFFQEIPDWILIFMIISGTITVTLFARPYRKHFIFKMDDIFFIVGIPSILMFIIIFAK